jgi:prephenate dehydrogenase
MFKNILIIGFGMIGSSIARTVLKKNKSIKIFAFDKSPNLKIRINKSKLKRVKVLKSLNEIKDQNIDFIIICTPMLQYQSIFKKLNDIDLQQTIVTDVGSTKVNIEKIYIQNKYQFNFIPSHPIAGIEKAGLENGFDGLFTNRYNIICPIKKSSKIHINKVIKFWRSLNMKTEIMSAKEHDKVLSLTSHLPHLISYSLVLTAMKKETSLNSKLVKFSAGGFRDFTRVAGSDPEMWRDIFLANSSQIQKLTSNFISELKEFSRNLNKGNSHNLLTKLKKTKNVRDKIVKARQAGKFIPND